MKTLIYAIQSNVDLILALIFRFPQSSDEEAKRACDGGKRSDSNRHESESKDSARRGNWRGVAVSDGRACDDRPPKNLIGGVEGDFFRDGWRKIGPCLGPEYADTTADENDDAEEQDSGEHCPRSVMSRHADEHPDRSDGAKYSCQSSETHCHGCVSQGSAGDGDYWNRAEEIEPTPCSKVMPFVLRFEERAKEIKEEDLGKNL